MEELTCCAKPNWDLDRTDLGHAASFEFMLGRCSNCGAYWLNVFSASSNTSGFERVSSEDARTMLKTPSGPELSALVYKWFCEH